MDLKGFIKEEYVTLNENNTVEEALSIMSSKSVNGAPVVNDENDLKGMVVKADIYRFLIEQGHYVTYPVSLVMSTNVITANKSDDLLDVTKRLRENDIMALPIVENEKVIGVLTLEDIVDYLIEK